jgi:transposase
MQHTAAPPSITPNDPQGIIADLSAKLAEVEQQNQHQAEQLQTQNEQLAKREQHIEQLLEYIELLRRKRFGASSDKLPDNQLNLFDESELEALIGELEAQAPGEDEEPPADSDEDATRKPKQKPVRHPLPPHLTRVERIIDLSDAEKAALGDEWTFIGYDSSEQLAVIPRQFYVIEYKRAKYVPLNDEVAGAEAGVKIAPRPAQIIPKSMAHASLLAHVVTAKFVDALPLYRQEKGFKRDGIEISRQTQAGWMTQLLGPLNPVAEALRRLLRQGRVIHVDETPLQVLKEPGREASQKSYMWVYRGGPPDKPVLWFHYTDSRAGAVAREFLFPGEYASYRTDQAVHEAFYLQSDGYAVYEALAKHPGVLGHAGCWAHVRRKFVDAANGRKNTAAAHQMVAYIGKLYAVERTIREAEPQERVRIRQEKSAPILETIKAWLDEKEKKTLPKGLLGKAIGYALGQWPILSTFLEDGHLEIDNNKAENAIRPFVIGRKNWLFAGSPRGAEASALLYSLIETAKANSLEPWAYLNHLFEQLPSAKTDEAIEALLPHNLKMDDLKTNGAIR